jgi:YgiT-type zinc finger domain-containing protein
MICALCGKAELVSETRDTPRIYKGHIIILRNVKGEWCPSCGMGYFGPEEGDDYDDYINAFRLFRNDVDSKVAAGISEREKFMKWYRARCQRPGNQEEIAQDAWEAALVSKIEWSKTGRPLNLEAAAMNLVKSESQIDGWHSLSEEIDELRPFLKEEKRWE